MKIRFCLVIPLRFLFFGRNRYSDRSVDGFPPCTAFIIIIVTLHLVHKIIRPWNWSKRSRVKEITVAENRLEKKKKLNRIEKGWTLSLIFTVCISTLSLGANENRVVDVLKVIRVLKGTCRNKALRHEPAEKTRSRWVCPVRTIQSVRPIGRYRRVEQKREKIARNSKSLGKRGQHVSMCDSLSRALFSATGLGSNRRCCANSRRGRKLRA